MTYPAWNDMDPSEKFEFLHEWCERLSRAVEEQRGVSQSLHKRLRKVEAKVAETS